MLTLKDIVKDYPTATTTVHALRSVSLNFRENEFVAILGPSGCGKTTMLNIIGGLDRYTSGDLIIGGVSTKEFDDEHWDAYRNATIGFVFQSYNLIPHLTVLENVELALSLVGEKKKVRRAKAVTALHMVNMHEEINKKPNQLSGGQMQRVAIARAIVNDPKIILADEPTGALDSELSVQVMDILKELAKTRLVIMVTHNSELAYQYASRICRFKDGQLIEDTNPYVPCEEGETVTDNAQESVDNEIAQNVTTDTLSLQNDNINIENGDNGEIKKEKKVSNRKRKLAMRRLGVEGNHAFDKLGLNSLSKKKRGKDKAFKPTAMSAGMAFGLSLRNLISKKRRTFFTAFAGSIGIIGLALVLSISNGFNIFVDDMQTEMLAGIPLGIYQYNVKDSAVMDMMLNMSTTTNEGLYPDSDEIKVNEGGDSGMGFVTDIIESFLDGVTKNDLSEDFAEYMKAMPEDYYSSMSVLYALRYNLIRQIEDEDGNIEYKDVSQLPGEITAVNIASTVLGENNLQSSTWQMLVGDEKNMMASYELIGENSKYPQNMNEIVLCINEDNSINSSLLSSFGFDFDKTKAYDVNDFIGQEFTLLDNDVYYQMSEDGYCEYPSTSLGKDSFKVLTYGDYDDDQQYLSEACEGDGAITLKVVGVIRKKKGSINSYVNSAFCYTPELANYVLEKSYNSKIAVAQRELDAQNVGKREKMTVFGKTLEEEEIVEGNTIKGLINTQEGVLQYTYFMRAIGASKSPSYVTVYPSNVTQKENAGNYINAWNEKDNGHVGYFDVSSMFLYNVNIILDLVSAMLIAVASISLVVSTVMIGVITSNSVIERIREIGILRAIGARKKDIRHVFIAETSLIGLSSGLIGIALTYVLCPLISLIIESVTGIGSLLHFNPLHALILVCLSLLLTVISGIIPAISASRKNVVDALRVD